MQYYNTVDAEILPEDLILLFSFALIINEIKSRDKFLTYKCL